MSVEEVTIGPCRLIRGDCLAVLPTLAPVDAVITDPPYGTGWVSGGGKHAGVFHAERHSASWNHWSLDWLAVAKAAAYAVFCPHMHLGALVQQPGSVLRYYIKSNPRPGWPAHDRQSVEVIVLWPRLQRSRGPQHRLAYNGNAVHPCEKPVSIMTWLVEDLTNPAQSVLDPFMGSGTTGVVCCMRERSFIGIEQDTAIFDLACQRIAAAYAQPDLFAPQAGAPRQEVLL